MTDMVTITLRLQAHLSGYLTTAWMFLDHPTLFSFSPGISSIIRSFVKSIVWAWIISLNKNPARKEIQAKGPEWQPSPESTECLEKTWETLSERPYDDLSCEHSGSQIPWEVHEQKAMTVLPRVLEPQPLFSSAPLLFLVGTCPLGVIVVSHPVPWAWFRKPLDPAVPC